VAVAGTVVVDPVPVFVLATVSTPPSFETEKQIDTDLSALSEVHV
jgi:hypothetical protein